jgi:NTP pyrophosphatase (non-canonical NTP hydrolase)
MKEAELYRAAIDNWGAASQLLMFFEETAELQKAICKLLRKNNTDLNRYDNVAEEIADVTLMLNQITQSYHLEHSVNDWKQIKLERLASLLKTTYEN